MMRMILESTLKLCARLILKPSSQPEMKTIIINKAFW